MVKYKISMKLRGTNDDYQHILDLQRNEESNPDIAFTSARREQIRESLQQQSACKVDDRALNHIVKTWKEDIEMGFRDSAITLDLPLLIESQINDINEPGNQEIPDLVSPNLSGIEPKFGVLPPLIF
jgi:hypothetical protein